MTDEGALKSLEEMYTGTYLLVTQVQYQKSRIEENKSIEESLNDVWGKIIEVTTGVINDE